MPGEQYGVPRKKSPLPWILAGGGVVVVAVVVVLIVALGGRDTSTPQGTAEAIVALLNDKDYAGLKEITCAERQDDIDALQKNVDIAANLDKLPEQLQQYRDQLAKVTFQASLGEVKQTDDTHATAEITIKYSGVPEAFLEATGGSTESSDKVPLRKEGEEWKFCDKK